MSIDFAETIRTAQEAVTRPEVQQMIKELGAYGLAVNIPHAHNADKLVQLDDGYVASEHDLRVSFRPISEIRQEKDIIDVGWRYNPKSDRVELCQCCAQC